MRLHTYVEDHAGEFFAALKQWLAIPSISTSPERHEDVRRSARWLADHLRDVGFPTAEVWETDGLPAVFAEWPAAEPDAPTVLVYGHHDVQPVDPLEEWHTEPFTPTEDGDTLRARGAADDKGQVFFHTLGVRTHLAATGRDTPAVNLKLIVEGEEESGSPHFAGLLARRKDRLACDVIVVSDTGMWDADTPSTCVSMRGMVDCDVDFTGPSGDIHSGVFGGTVPNPLTELCRVLGGLHDADGRVAVGGFYDDVVPLGAAERELVGKLPFDEAAWLANAKSSATAGERGFGTLERAGARPTAELNGLWGGYTGPGHKTIIPASAHAKLSFRLVAAQEPARVKQLFEEWLNDRVPPGIGASVTWHGPGVSPCATPIDHPALAAVARALSRVFDREVLFTREGGSGPEAALQDMLAAPVVFLGVSLPDDGWHAPNEKVEMPLLLAGAQAAANLWQDLPEALRR